MIFFNRIIKKGSQFLTKFVDRSEYLSKEELELKKIDGTLSR
jgi:hypothetical protein